MSKRRGGLFTARSGMARTIIPMGAWASSFAGSTGSNDGTSYSIGGKFTLSADATITAVGIYSPAGSTSLPDSGCPTLTWRICKSTATGIILITQTFAYNDGAAIDATTKVLSHAITPTVLVAGDYYLWVNGYAASYGYHAAGSGSNVSRNTLGGKLTWESGARYGTPPNYPSSAAGGEDYIMATLAGY